MLWRLACQRYTVLSCRTAAAAFKPASTAAHPFHHQASGMLCTSHTVVLRTRCPLQLRSSTQQQLWTGASHLPAGPTSRSFSLQHRSTMANMHAGNARSKGSGRPLLPLEAAGGGGGAGSGGKKGYSNGDSSSGGSGGLWEAYNSLLQQYPLLIKAITTALLSAVGNLICQFFVEGKSELDWRRFNTFTVLGFIWVAPCLHFWFGALNKIVTSPGNVGALMRMALDQLGFAPLFISSMIAILAGLDGKSLDQCISVVKRDLPDAIRANWALWVPAQFINFRFVPASYQVLFANMVALLWNVYFSFATRPKTA